MAARLAAALLLACAAACGSGTASAPGPEVPENAEGGSAASGAAPAVGYFAAGTLGQNPAATRSGS